MIGHLEAEIGFWIFHEAEAEIWFEGLKGPEGALLKRTRELLLVEMERYSLGRVQTPE